MPSNEVLVEVKERVATITLNRPDVLNAVHREMFEEIRAAALELDDDPEVGAIILTGAGRGFCSGVDVSGHDFGASADRTPTVYAYEGGPVGIYNIRKPTIAAVGGPAVGVGLGMALACDVRIASDDARFTTGLARVGLPSVDGLGWTLPRLVGEAKALELIYTAEMIDAKEAERIGLVSYVVPRDELQERAFDLARRFADGPPFAAYLSKFMVRKGANLEFEQYLPHEYAASLNNRFFAGHDISEAAQARKEKRKPAFKGTTLTPRDASTPRGHTDPDSSS